VPPPGTPKRVGTLNCRLVRKHKQQSGPVPPPEEGREATLSSTGVNPNVHAHNRAAVSMPTPALRLSQRAIPELTGPLSRRLVPEPKPCIEVSPTISSRNRSASRTSSGSFSNREVMFHVPRASFSSRGPDRQGLRLRLLPSSNCNRPSWPLPRVVSPSKSGPMSSLRAVPGHQALVAWPHPQAWLQGEAPVTHVRARDNVFQESFSS